VIALHSEEQGIKTVYCPAKARDQQVPVREKVKIMSFIVEKSRGKKKM
jgi:hypothetical protein